LLTIPWAIYRLIKKKKSKTTLAEQLVDCVVAQTNLVSLVVFACGGFLFTLPRQGDWSKRIKYGPVWFFLGMEIEKGLA
jgi:hypothetical protein